MTPRRRFGRFAPAGLLHLLQEQQNFRCVDLADGAIGERCGDRMQQPPDLRQCRIGHFPVDEAVYIFVGE